MCKENPGQFDLTVSDVKMSKRQGKCEHIHRMYYSASVESAE